MSRKRNKRYQKHIPTMQICTEGATEALYIKAFIERVGANPFVSLNGQRCAHGCGRSHLSLLDKMQECGRSWHVDCVWMVNDFDAAEQDKKVYDSFCKSISLSNELGYRVAYSVPNIEFWLLLHIHYFDTSFSRDVCTSKFKEKINGIAVQKGLPTYGRNDHKTDPDLFMLLGDINGATTARKNAEKLFQTFDLDPNSVFEMNTGEIMSLFKRIRPSTNMYLLLQDIKDRCSGTSMV